jgi:serine/threonine protein kinase
LIALLRDTRGPIDLSDRSLVTLLPEAEREWIAASALELAIALRRRDGEIAAVVLLGRRRDDRPYDRSDVWFLTTVASAAADAWDEAVRRGRATGEPAYECPRCGWVAGATPLACGCDAGAILAALPHRLAGKFVVERRIGAGGMGVAYLARDVTLDRDVVLKTLPNLRAGDLARLDEEARAMASVNHEGLATIYGLERWRRTPILVVEYFPNGTLADRLRNGPLSVDAVLTLGVRLCHALECMHAKGVIHRDVKPSNIALTPAGAPKLLDFGLAGLSTAFAGTPGYQPPDAGDSVLADPALDLWALSVVLFEALTGRNPFVDRVSLHPNDRKSLDPPVRAFFERAFAIDSENRFRTAQDLREALAALAGRH